jgi:hypothetical protein
MDSSGPWQRVFSDKIANPRTPLPSSLSLASNTSSGSFFGTHRRTESGGVDFDLQLPDVSSDGFAVGLDVFSSASPQQSPLPSPLIAPFAAPASTTGPSMARPGPPSAVSLFSVGAGERGQPSQLPPPPPRTPSLRHLSPTLQRSPEQPSAPLADLSFTRSLSARSPHSSPGPVRATRAMTPPPPGPSPPLIPTLALGQAAAGAVAAPAASLAEPPVHGLDVDRGHGGVVVASHASAPAPAPGPAAEVAARAAQVVEAEAVALAGGRGPGQPLAPPRTPATSVKAVDVASVVIPSLPPSASGAGPALAGPVVAAGVAVDGGEGSDAVAIGGPASSSATPRRGHVRSSSASSRMRTVFDAALLSAPLGKCPHADRTLVNTGSTCFSSRPPCLAPLAASHTDESPLSAPSELCGPCAMCHALVCVGGGRHG